MPDSAVAILNKTGLQQIDSLTLSLFNQVCFDISVYPDCTTTLQDVLNEL